MTTFPNFNSLKKNNQMLSDGGVAKLVSPLLHQQQQQQQ